MSPVDPSQLDRALAQIKKEYGEDAVRLANSYPDPQRISTGSLELDIVTGGGYPVGRIIHEYGGQFSAKTLIAYKVIANAQAMGQECVLYDAEKQFNENHAKRQGINTDKLIVIEENTIEDLGTKMENLMGAAHLHVVDSIPATVSMDELAAGNDEWRPGIGARAWGKTLRRIQDRFDSKENTLILINHVGMVFGKYSGGEEPKGARFIEYLSSLSLEFRRSSWLMRGKDGNLTPKGESEDTLSGDKTPGGIEFQVRVKKSRVCVPFQSARLRLDFHTGSIDDEWSIFKAAELYGLVKKSGSWYTMPDESKAQGEAGVRKYLIENPDFRNEVIDAIKDTSR